MRRHDSPLSGAERPIPPERRLRVAEVRKTTPITPHMQRLTLASTALMDFPVRRPAQWVKLFVPSPHSEKPSGRAYTIRHFREELCEMDIDFVLHGDGPCSSWAASAKPGDVVQIAGPRSGFQLGPDTNRLLIGGDETALPAIGSILEALPPGLAADAFIEVPDGADVQVLHSRADVAITWLLRSRGTGPATDLATAMIRADVPARTCDIWFAAEASVARAIRRHFQLGRAMPRERLTISGYWKRGETDFHDREGDQ